MSVSGRPLVRSWQRVRDGSGDGARRLRVPVTRGLIVSPPVIFDAGEPRSAIRAFWASGRRHVSVSETLAANLEADDD